MEVALDIIRGQRTSFSSEDDTESVYSVQEKETDVVQDSDDEEYNDASSTSTLELEYEVATSDDSDDATAAQYKILLGARVNGQSSSGEEDLNVTAAIAAVLCDSSLEAWATDGEDSDTTACNDSVSSATSGRGAGFATCLQCNGRNDQPKVQYCDKCFQRCWQCKSWKSYNCFPLCNDCYKVRKNLFPPRPRGTRKRKLERLAAEEAETQVLRKRNSSNSLSDVPSVKLTTLQHCLSGLSQDSGLGSSQEIPGLNFDKIVMPNKSPHDLKRRHNSIDSDTLNRDADDISPPNSKIGRLEMVSSDVKNLPCSSKTVILNSAIIEQSNRSKSNLIDVVKTSNIVLSDTSTAFRTNSVDHPNEKFSYSSRSKSIEIKNEITLSNLNDSSAPRKNTSTDVAIPGFSKNTNQIDHLQFAPTQHITKVKISPSLEELHKIDKQAESSDFEYNISASANNISNRQSNSDLGSIAHCSKDSLHMGPLPELKELCIICNVNPKNGIFLHGKIAHLCCCYKCAMKTWLISKRCPICNCKVKNVVKVFTT